MSLVPLLPLFHRLNREHFQSALAVGGKPLVAVRWSDGRMRKTAGMFRFGLKGARCFSSEIVLSRPVLEHLPQSAIESTLCHEMIHAWVHLVLKVNESHGLNFCSRMASINASQSDFQVTVRHQFPVHTNSVRWWAVCSKCGLRAPSKRRLRDAACRHCCNLHHGGKWHESCLLIYEPYKKVN